jgi:uncharacterized oligopeptide transporter (OPT) family protein
MVDNISFGFEAGAVVAGEITSVVLSMGKLKAR